MLSGGSKAPPFAHISQLRGQSIQHLYENVTVALWASVVIALFAFALLWSRIPTILLITWSLLFITLTLFRFVLTKKYQVSTNKESGFWYEWYLGGIGNAGIFWGALIFLALQQEDTLILQFTVLLIAGLCAGVAVSASTSMMAYLFFAVPATLPGSIYLLTSGQPSHTFIEACLFIFFIFLTILEKIINTSTLSNLYLQHSSAQLNLCLRSVINHIHQAIVIIHAKTDLIIDVNDQACQVFQYSPTELINHPFQQLLHQEDIELGQMQNRAKRKGEAYSSHQKFMTKSGNRIYLETTLSVIQSDHGKFIICLLRKSDISEDTTSSANLAKQNERMFKATKSLASIRKNDYLYITDTLYSEVNPKLKEIEKEIYSISKKQDLEEVYPHLDNIINIVQFMGHITRNLAQHLRNALYLAK